MREVRESEKRMNQRCFGAMLLFLFTLVGSAVTDIKNDNKQKYIMLPAAIIIGMVSTYFYKDKP